MGIAALNPSYNLFALALLECYFSIILMRTELVTTLKRKASKIISDLEREHAPVLITQHGRPAAYLVDVETYEKLHQRVAVLEGIARG
jgi:prevent-host-death family protein